MCYRCDWCDKSCRTGDAFCSEKCADDYHAESLAGLHNHRSDVFKDHLYDSYHRNEELVKCGAD